MKASEQFFPVVLLICKLYKVVLTFGSVAEILQCLLLVYFTRGAVYYSVQGDSIFEVCEWNLKLWPFKQVKKKYCPLALFIILYTMVLTFGSVDEILKSDHTNETSFFRTFTQYFFSFRFVQKKLELFDNFDFERPTFHPRRHHILVSTSLLSL